MAGIPTNPKDTNTKEPESCPPAFRTTDQESLRKLLECPFCKEVVKPPIFTCKNNHHMICEECRKRFPHVQCPICKTPISETRCTFVEKCMERVFLQCKFKKDGCQLSLKANEFRNHLLLCPFRQIQCFMLKCGKSIHFKQFFEHLKIDHSDKVNGVENEYRHAVEWWIEGDASDIARWPPYYFTCFNNVFLYTAISTIHGMWEWAYVLADEEEASRFQVTSTISSTDKTTELKWKGAVHPIRKPIPDIASTGFCFVTNSKEMRNPFLFRKPDNPRYFWRTDVEIIQISQPKLGTTSYILTTEKHEQPGFAIKLVSNSTGSQFIQEEFIVDQRKSKKTPTESAINNEHPEFPMKLVSTGTSTNEFIKEEDLVDLRKSRKTIAGSVTINEAITELLALQENASSLSGTHDSAFKIDGSLLEFSVDIPSTTDKHCIPLTEIGNQNEVSSSPKQNTRQFSVQIPPELIEKLSSSVEQEQLAEKLRLSSLSPSALEQEQLAEKLRLSSLSPSAEQVSLTEKVEDVDRSETLNQESDLIPNSESSQIFQLDDDMTKKTSYFKISNLDDDQYSQNEKTN